MKRRFVHDQIRERLLRPVELVNNAKRRPPLSELRKTENNRHVWDLCDNRMVMGCFRYETIADKQAYYDRHGHSGYDLLGSVERRIENYRKSGNLEFLIDSINLLAIEFRFPSHKNAHFHAVDDGEHTQRVTA